MTETMASAILRIPLVRPCARTARSMIRWGRFVADFIRFRRLARQSSVRFTVRWRDRSPYLNDRTATSVFDRHYVYHLAWAARILQETAPACHFDISSSLHFCSMLSAFVPVRFYEYRPVDLGLSNLVTGPADLTALPFADGSVQSLSCMHVVEHIGLGRYGDPLDPDGDAKAMAQLKRVLAPGGSLLFVVPTGKPRLQFNAHRVYAYRQVLGAFEGLKLRRFALVPDSPEDGGLVEDATAAMADRQVWGCGCYWFVRE